MPDVHPPAPDRTLPSTPRHSEQNLHRVFVGPDGLRAGWSLLLFGLFAVLLGTVANLGLRLVYHPAQPTPGSALSPLSAFFADALAFLSLLAAARIMSFIESRPFRCFGLAPTPRAIPHLLAGLVWGLLFLALLVAALTASHLLVFSGVLLPLRAAIGYGLAWFAAFLAVAFAEEFALRGYVQYTLTRGLSGALRATTHSPRVNLLGFWLSALFFSFLFGFGHRSNPGESPIGLLSAGLIGLVFCLSLWRTGALWWAIGFHAAWDWAQSFLFGVADSGMLVQHHLLHSQTLGRPLLSGGTTGPEGSLYILAVIPLVSVVILLTLRPSPEPSALGHGPLP